MCVFCKAKILDWKYFENLWEGVQELASLLNISLVIKLHTTCYFSLGFIKMDVRAVKGSFEKGESLAFVNCESKSRDNGNLFNKNNETLVWKFDEYISFQYWVDANNAKQKFGI
jgi:hypothetical protein